MSQSKIIPALRYNDAPAAIKWLGDAFGFEPHLVVPGEAGTVAHAQLTLGDDMVMVGSAHASDFDRFQTTPDKVGHIVTQSLYIIVGEVDAHCAKARSLSAEIVVEPADQDYGGRAYTCKDIGGHLWTFGTYDPWL